MALKKKQSHTPAMRWLDAAPVAGATVLVSHDNSVGGMRITQAYEVVDGRQVLEEGTAWAAPLPGALPMFLQCTYDPAGSTDVEVVVRFVEEDRGKSVSAVLDGPPARTLRIRLRPTENGWIDEAIIAESTDGASRLLYELGLRDVAKAIDALLHTTLAQTVLGPTWSGVHRRKPGRTGRDDLFYAQWAQRYVDACARSRRPLRDLVEEEGGAITKETVNGYLKLARKRGLLTDAPSGRGGGDLTEKAEGLLRLRAPKG